MQILKMVSGSPQPYSIQRLRTDNYNTSFPKNFSADVLLAFDCYPYTRPAVPAIDHMTQDLNDAPFIQDAEGNWSRGWSVTQKPQADAEANVRTRRDELLAEKNHHLMAKIAIGTPVPSDVDAYMQALRDVPNQAGFPYNVSWPTDPEAETV